MRLAANMTGGHIAILAILSFVFIFTEMFGTWMAGAGVGIRFSVRLRPPCRALNHRRSRAYVFTLLTAVFIGMAIHHITSDRLKETWEWALLWDTQAQVSDSDWPSSGRASASASWQPARRGHLAATECGSADRRRDNLALFLLEGVAILACSSRSLKRPALVRVSNDNPLVRRSGCSSDDLTSCWWPPGEVRLEASAGRARGAPATHRQGD